MTDVNATSFSFEVDGDNVGWITFDQPDARVNLLTTEVMEELDDVLSGLESRIATGKLVAVVIRSGKDDNFIAGADVDEIAGLDDAEVAATKAREGQRIFRRLDRLNVPVVAAVHGTCMGGGTELALACDHRVASDAAKTSIGLPETQLGILPGFGGTVRLPRQCGIQNALEIILAGKSVSASKAERIGLVDELLVHERFDEELRDFVNRLLYGSVERGSYELSFLERLLEETGPGRLLLFWMARRRTRKRTGGRYPAPMRALDVIEATHDMPLDQALDVEARALGELAVTTEARDLIRIFQLRQRARKALPASTMEKQRTVEKAAVLGAGVMGGGIAELVASKDVPVLLKDIDREPLDDGLRHARELLDKAARKGVFSEERAGLKFALIEGTLSYDGFEDVDLIVEAVVERMAVKKQVLREAEEVIPEETVFATNTSSLSVGDLAEAADRPERILGLHFFNPVHKMPLVELIHTDATSDAALATAMGFALDMGKTPVLVTDGPGFLVNRLLAPYLNEAGWLLEEGVGVKAIDDAVDDFGMPMGPLRLLDEVGLDVARHVSEEMESAFGERMKPAGIVGRMLDDGRLGKKNGLGFYLYEKGDAKKVDPGIRRMIENGGRSSLSSEEIRRRCLYPMVNEAAWALEDEIVEDAGMVDLAMIMGTGFPPFRGGLLRWADREGLERIVETLDDYAERLGERFLPAPLLRSRAEEGRSFTDPETPT